MLFVVHSALVLRLGGFYFDARKGRLGWDYLVIGVALEKEDINNR